MVSEAVVCSTEVHGVILLHFPCGASHIALVDASQSEGGIILSVVHYENVNIIITFLKFGVSIERVRYLMSYGRFYVLACLLTLLTEDSLRSLLFGLPSKLLHILVYFLLELVNFPLL